MTKLTYCGIADTSVKIDTACVKEQPAYDTDSLERLVTSCNQHLQIDLTAVKFMVLSEENAIYFLGHSRDGAAIMDDTGDLFLAIRGDLDQLGMGGLLAHELTHIGQFQRGELLCISPMDDTWEWKGSIYKKAYGMVGAPGLSYEQATAGLPWETEAVNEQNNFLTFLLTQR